MVPDLYNKAAELASQGQPFAVATVVQVEGSSSAKRGSKALFGALGQLVAGWIGGGCAESAVRSEALKSLETERPRMLTVDMSDEELGVGMPCGGKMEIFIEPVLPKPDLLIVGHGRIAEMLALLGHWMGFSVTVNDPGAEASAFPLADRLVTEDFDLVETPIGPRSYVVIATQHKRDHLWLQKALEGNATYIALIASRHRAQLVLEYLREAGLPAEKLDTVWAPAGLDIAAATPEEIALSVMSQMVALRRGGTAGVLSRNRSDREAQQLATDRVIRQCEVDSSS
jgi:xanthine dehydrogenase accessory factor